jgi:hypothetical protein
VACWGRAAATRGLAVADWLRSVANAAAGSTEPTDALVVAEGPGVSVGGADRAQPGLSPEAAGLRGVHNPATFWNGPQKQKPPPARPSVSPPGFPDGFSRRCGFFRCGGDAWGALGTSIGWMRTTGDCGYLQRV